MSNVQMSTRKSTEWILAAGGFVAMIFASVFVLGGGLLVGAFMALVYYRGNRTAQIGVFVLGAAVSVIVVIVLMLGLYLPGHSSSWMSPPTTVNLNS